jgi:hypothetical protein
MRFDGDVSNPQTVALEEVLGLMGTARLELATFRSGGEKLARASSVPLAFLEPNLEAPKAYTARLRESTELCLLGGGGGTGKT